MPAALLDKVAALHDIADTPGPPAARGASEWPDFTTTTSAGYPGHTQRYMKPAYDRGFHWQMVRAPGGVDNGSSTIKYDDILRATEQTTPQPQLGAENFVSAFQTLQGQCPLLRKILHTGGDFDRIIQTYGRTAGQARIDSVTALWSAAGFDWLSLDTGGGRTGDDEIWTQIPLLEAQGFHIMLEPFPSNLAPDNAMTKGAYTIYDRFKDHLNPANPLSYYPTRAVSLIQGPMVVQVPDQTNLGLTKSYVAELVTLQAMPVIPYWWLLPLGTTYEDLVPADSSDPMPPPAKKILHIETVDGRTYNWAYQPA